VGKALGIDFGVKRTGIAISDNEKILASGLTTVSTNLIYGFISELFIREEIDFIVVGLPKNLKNQPTDATMQTERFINRLKNIYRNKPIYTIDERFTSKIAKRVIVSSGIKKNKRRDKNLVDKISAAIILQDYIDNIM
tara:strand:+ start:21 stop:434 length:414 start_codon:yes stop_codon:yes gene_type:complete